MIDEQTTRESRYSDPEDGGTEIACPLCGESGISRVRLPEHIATDCETDLRNAGDRA